ncbi:MAG: twin-arginine translocation signal domain-containing protein [Actinomycetes bacterium]
MPDLETDPTATGTKPGLSRRDLMKRSAIVGAGLVWTAPLVQSVASGRALAAGTPGTTGSAKPTLQCYLFPTGNVSLLGQTVTFTWSATQGGTQQSFTWTIPSSPASTTDITVSGTVPSCVGTPSLDSVSAPTLVEATSGPCEYLITISMSGQSTPVHTTSCGYIGVRL